MKTIGFIGVGKMATAIISGLNKDKFKVFISGRDIKKTKQQAKDLQVSAVSSHHELVEKSDLIVLSIKPQVLPKIADEILSALTAEKTILSIAAGYTLSDLEHLMALESMPIIRVMPNINAQIGRSTSAIVKNDFVSDNSYAFAKAVFENVGSVHEVAEKDFSTFTALAGSSPAYIYMFIDALSRAGVLHGMSKEASLSIVADTVAASAEMVLQSGENPWTLVDQVSSPGGTTIAGVVSLEQNRFVATVIDAITATIDKEKGLI